MKESEIIHCIISKVADFLKMRSKTATEESGNWRRESKHITPTFLREG